LACALLATLFVLDLLLRPGGARLTRELDDLAELAAAAWAAGACLWRAHRLAGRSRLAWSLLGAGCGAWALGEAVWSYYEIIAGSATPFPSLADIGFLLFPVLALAGLLSRPSTAFTRHGRTRVALDALLVSASLFLISWVTALGSVYRAGADTVFGAAVSLAYPLTDVILLAVTIVVLAFARAGHRGGLSWVAAGITALSVGDSGFAYLTATSHYGVVNLIDAGWVVGFLLLGAAAVVDREGSETSAHAALPRTALLLPYVPASVAVGVVLHSAAVNRLDIVAATATCAIIAALVGRQMLVLTDNRRLMSRVSHQAFHDVLTGLANRALFADRLTHALELHRRDMRDVTVLLIDLDDFKTVNDSLGHPAGDELLVRVSERLRAVVRTGDTVARLGGDEFAVLVEDGGDAVDLASRILASLDRAVILAGRSVPVEASIGIATLAGSDASATDVDMLKRADMAMYAAKRAGKATVCTYSGDLELAESGQLDLRTAFAADLAAGLVNVAFQPIQMADGSIGGFEALARWTHEGTAVTPATFLPMARRLGAVADLDRLVISKAVDEAARWRDRLVLSVNLDGASLADPDFASDVIAMIAGRLDPRRLAVEVLESSLIEHDEQALLTLATLRAAGVRVAVDDFGAGYASLLRLHALKPDVVKIDRSLMATLTEPGSPLLGSVATLAHQMGAIVVAEGVETEDQLSAALAAGCDAVQGYLLGRPTDADGCRKLLGAVAVH
jgi:diguanylate cyclase (GGDEF)-like protein